MRATQRYRQASRAALVGLLANLALGGLKLTVGVAQQSFALIADAVNSLGDGLASLVVLASFRVSQRPPDAEHPYGHSKAEGIAASNVAVLVVLSGVLVGVEALRRFDVVHPAPTSIVLWIAGGNAIIKEGLFRYKMAVGKRVGSTALIANAWDHRADALCALAVLAGAIALSLGAPLWADEAAALVVVGAIVGAGISLYRKAAHDLMDPQAESAQLERVRALATAVPGVAALDVVTLRKSGLVYFLDIHVQVDPQLTVEVGHGIGHRVKDTILEQMPEVADVLVHLEPSA